MKRSGRMLRANAEGAGLAGYFDELLSTEVNKTYKPDPKAYALGPERLKLAKEEILFAAFGSWAPRALPAEVDAGSASGNASKQKLRVFPCFNETWKDPMGPRPSAIRPYG